VVKVSITFSKEDHLAVITRPKRCPLVLNPTIRNVGLGKMLIDRGSGLDILFACTLKELRLTAMNLNPTDRPFISIVPGDPLVPLGVISLSVTFSTIENYQTEYV
jgi:hypothetical protein